MVKELSRGAIMNMYYSGFAFLFLLVIFYHIYLEIKSVPRHRFKTIPFYAFSCMVIGIFLRVLLIIPTYTQNVSDPNSSVFFWSVFVIAIEMYLNVYFFVGLIWIRIVVVYFKNESINFTAQKYVNRVIMATSFLSGICGIALIIANSLIESDICDLLARIKLLIITVLIAFSLLIFGTKLINELTKSSNESNNTVIPKIKFLLYGISIAGLPSSILPIIYYYYGKHRPAQDWLNLALYCVEVWNNANILMVFGRSKFCLHMRKIMGSPELELYNTKSKSSRYSIRNSSNSKSNESGVDHSSSPNNKSTTTIELSTVNEEGAEIDTFNSNENM